MKIADIDRESLHSNLNQIFRKYVTYDIKSHKKVTRKEGFTLSSEDTFLEKSQGGNPAVFRVKNIKDKIPDITHLVMTTALNAKINEVKNKMPNIANLATAITAVENKMDEEKI